MSDGSGEPPSAGEKKPAVRIKRCPGCKTPHSLHGFGEPSKHCTGEADHLESIKMNLDLIKQDVELISQPGAVPMASLNLTADSPEAEVDLEEVSKLVDELKQLELEEEALIRKKRVQELREMVELKKKAVHDLKMTSVSSVNSGGLKSPIHTSKPSGTDCKNLNTKSLKKLVPGIPDEVCTPLDNLLGAAGVVNNSEFGLTPGNGPSQGIGDFISQNDGASLNKPYKASSGGVTGYSRAEISCSNLLTADGQAKLLLQPKTPAGKSYFKITDFVDSIIQTNHEEVLTENSVSRLLINYGPKRIKLEDVSVHQYVVAALRILYQLVETNQLSSYNEIQHYLAYVIKCMEFAMHFEWSSVLHFDDKFRQLQALHGVPWVFESFHLSAKELIPKTRATLANKGRFRASKGRGRFGDRPSASGNYPNAYDESVAQYTDEGQVICKNFNRVKGCSLLDCKFAHVCNRKLSNQKACGQTHPKFQHDA